jgi:hypothetical protein
MPERHSSNEDSSAAQQPKEQSLQPDQRFQANTNTAQKDQNEPWGNATVPSLHQRQA